MVSLVLAGPPPLSASVALICATTSLILGPAGTAIAASVRVAQDRLIYRANAGELNDVLMRPIKDGMQIEIEESTAPLSARAGCASVARDSKRARCDAPGIRVVELEGGDLDDTLEIRRVALPAVLNGGAGNDILVGATGNDQLDGHSGDDQIKGGDGDDLVQGGAGADELNGGGGADTIKGGKSVDTLNGGFGADVLDGGSGFDTVTYAARTAPLVVSLDGIPNDGEALESDNVLDNVDSVVGGHANDVMSAAPRTRSSGRGSQLKGGGGDDMLTGGGAADDLMGGPGDDILQGDGGNDLLTGSAGKDALSGGAGSDIAAVRGGGADDVDCGPGDDSAGADGADTIDPDCESLPRQGNGGNKGIPLCRSKVSARIRHARRHRPYLEVKVSSRCRGDGSIPVVKVTIRSKRRARTVLTVRVIPSRWIRVRRTIERSSRSATAEFLK